MMAEVERQLAIVTNSCCEFSGHGRPIFILFLRLVSGMDKGKNLQKTYPYGEEIPDYLRRDLLRLSCPVSSPKDLPFLKDKLRGVMVRIALEDGKIHINDYFGRGDPNKYQ